VFDQNVAVFAGEKTNPFTSAFGLWGLVALKRKRKEKYSTSK